MKKNLLAGLLALLFVFALAGCGGAAAGDWQKNYDLGAKYLSDGNYKEAVTAFTAAIKIDAKQPKAYAGLADAYVGLGESDKAAKALSDGVAATGDSALQTRLDNLQSGGAASSSASGADSASGTGGDWTLGSRIQLDDGNYLLITKVDEKTGIVTEQEKHKPDGTLIATEEYAIAPDGSRNYLTKMVLYDTGSAGPLTYIFEYGDDLKATRMTTYNPDGTVNVYHTYEYDGGNTIDTVHNPDGTVVTTSTYPSEG